MDRCILVATNGGPAATGALRCGRDLGVHFGLPLEVITVCEPLGVFGYGSAELAADLLQDKAEAACRVRRKAISDQLTAEGVDCNPAIHVEIGEPAKSIGRTATARGTRLLVVGRGRHSPLDRVIGDEIALRLMQAAHIPVLSVPESYHQLPERVLAAVDFTSYSLDAALSAAALLPPGGELHIVHVNSEGMPGEVVSRRETQWMKAMRRELESRLELMADEISRSAPAVAVTAHLRDGRPVPTVMRLAEDLGADLLAAGTSGYGFLGRLLMGSVATQLVRRARCMILIAPPRGVVPLSDRSTPHLRRRRAPLMTEEIFSPTYILP